MLTSVGKEEMLALLPELTPLFQIWNKMFFHSSQIRTHHSNRHKLRYRSNLKDSLPQVQKNQKVVPNLPKRMNNVPKLLKSKV